MDVNVYLTFDGRCAEAFAEYARHPRRRGRLRADLRRDAHGGAHAARAARPGDAFRAKLGDKVIMGSDAPPEWYTTPGGFSVSLHFDDLEEGRRAFDALAEGGTVKMALQETFWAKGFGMLIDRFGTPWIVNCGHAGGQG